MSVILTEKPRVNFASIKNPLPFPDFLEVQLKSFKDFLQLDVPPEDRKNQGLYKVFAENFPIADTRNNFVLEFLDYYIDPPRYTIDECLERGLTYSVPLKAKLKLYCTDPAGYVCDKWRRACCCVAAPPFAGCLFRTKHSCQRNKTIFSSYYPLQGQLD